MVVVIKIRRTEILKKNLEKILNPFVFFAILFIVYDTIEFFYYGLTDSFSGFDPARVLVNFEMWAFFLGVQIICIRISDLESRVKEFEDKDKSIK